MFRRGTVAARAPAVKADLESRLVALRLRQERAPNGVATGGAVLGCGIGVQIANFFGTFMMIPLSASGASNFEVALIIELLLMLAAGIGVGVGGWYLARWGARRMIARYHAQTWYELHETNFMTMAVDDIYTHVILERIENVWSLRWISPPPPKNLEQQLEFAACYQLALRRMLRGVGRLDNGPLWQGGLSWYAGLGKGIACGCLALLLFSALGLAIVIVGAVFHLQRSAALIAYCDFLLYDERMAQAAREGRLSSPVTSSTQAHRPPPAPTESNLNYDDQPERNE